MTRRASPKLPRRLALLGAATATGLWVIALLVYAAMPAASPQAPPMLWADVALGYAASVVVFGGLGWVLGLASR